MSRIHYEVNFDPQEFEPFGERKGRAPILPWKTCNEFFVPKSLEEMNAKKGRPSAPHGWNTRAVKSLTDPNRCGYHCFKTK